MKLFLVSLGVIFSSLFAMAGQDGGGGDGIPGQYSAAANRAVSAIKIICQGVASPDQDTAKACSYLAPLQLAVATLKVEPRSRDTLFGADGKPRDGGNDRKQTALLDVDRWLDKQYEKEPNRILDARTQQLRLAFHEPLILAGVETDDLYTVSDKFIEMLVKNNFSFDNLVGKPEVIATRTFPCKFSVRSNLNPSYPGYEIDSDSEAFLISQGKQVAEDERMSEFRIYLLYAFDSHESLAREVALGSIFTNIPHYAASNKRVVIQVLRAFDGVTVYKNSVSGSPSLSTKKQLIDGLANIQFTCNSQ